MFQSRQNGSDFRPDGPPYTRAKKMRRSQESCLALATGKGEQRQFGGSV
jgi:hypothetical protein